MKKITKSIFTACMTLALISAFCLSAFAAGITRQQAIDTALADAGLTSSEVSRITVDREKNTYEIDFYHTASGDKYEYEISSKNGRIKEADIDYAHQWNDSRKKVSKKAAIKAASKVSGVKQSVIKKGTIKLKTDDGERIYKIKFRSGSYKYECEVLAPTGQVIEFSKEYKGR